MGFCAKVRREKRDCEIQSRLVGQSFSQMPEINYKKIYSLMMNSIMFRYLISLTVSKNLEMRLMDVVTTYLYGLPDSDIFMKLP